MPLIKDLTGQRFGRLVVQSTAPDRDDLSRSMRKQWICQCDCGNTKIVAGTSLRSGNTRSCGCVQKESTSQKCLKDMIGIRVGRLVVLQRSQRKHAAASWECACDCGNKVTVSGANLRAGRTTSCGCAAMVGHRREYERIHGEIPAGYMVTTRDGNPYNLSPNNLCLLSSKDMDKLNHMIRGATRVSELRRAAIKVIEMECLIRDIESELL